MRLVHRGRGSAGWRMRAGVSTLLALAMLASPGVARAMPDPVLGPRGPSPVGHDRPVPGRAAAMRPAKPSLVDQRAIKHAPRVSWPAAGTVDLAGGPGRAGGLPVSLAGSGIRVRVETLDHAAAVRAGVAGVLVRVSAAGGGRPAERVALSLDYSGFKAAFGGDWASRLALVRMSDRTVMPATNDVKAGRLTAQVPIATAGPTRSGTTRSGLDAATAGADTSGTVFALTAAASSGAGDYTATSLAPSATWQVGTQTGDFTWNYPVPVPDTPGDLIPQLSLAYSSGDIDGRVSSTNNQPGWVGDGWSMWGGFIERGYKGCASDGITTGAGDLCWGTDNATLSFNGGGGELVKDDTTHTWHLRNDDATKVEHVNGTDTDTHNGDNDNEWWKVTTTDGTQYWFGRNRLPGWVSGNPETNAAWTVPVFGNNDGEPCHGTSFGVSACTQAWRWNLDYVVDAHGNSMSYFYHTEINYYDQNRAASGTAYVRGGWLDHINYGTRTAAAYATPPAQVQFDVLSRCIDTCADLVNNATAPNSNWPDVPADQYCSSATCTNKFSPTFFTLKKLSKITTKAGTTSVGSWDLSYTFPSPGDGSSAALWLRSISRHGLAGTQVDLPAVTFDGADYPNRVNVHAGWAPLNKFRLTTIHNETGGQIDIGYAAPDCPAGQMPDPTSTAAQAGNTKRCFVQWWTEPGGSAQADWFHKYAVSRVLQSDLVGGNAIGETDYEYLGGGAWHFPDSNELAVPVPPAPDHRTWSVWRGYAQVRVRAGSSAEGPQTRTDYRYYRGMDGDRQSPGGVTVSDSLGTQYTDGDGLAGFLLEQTTFNGDTQVSTTIHDPVRVRTAAHSYDGMTVAAYRVDTAADHGRINLDGGEVRRTQITYTYDDYGNATRVEDFGDLGTSADDRCTNSSFASNPTLGVFTGKPYEVTTKAVACPTTPTYPEDTISARRTYYDASATLGQMTGPGDATRTTAVKSYTGTPPVPVFVTTSTTSYDSFGRVTRTADALSRATSTAYTDTNGLTTQTVVTSPAPMSFATTTTIDPALGRPTHIVDANGLVTDLDHDALGRLTRVWLPNRDKTTQDANLTFAYLIRTTAPSVVTSSRLGPNANYISSYTLYDGFLRARQTQSPAECTPQDRTDPTTLTCGGRVVTDQSYDSRGLLWRSNAAYYNVTALGTPGHTGPGTDLLDTPDNQVPGQTVTVFDGAARATASIFVAFGAEQWHTTTDYHGDHTDVTPPAGATPTTTYVDARGQTTSLRQYHAATPAGAYDQTTYTYTKAGQPATVTDPAGNVWTNTYDLLGRTVTTADPDRGTTTMTYDNAGQLLTRTDARGKKLSFGYDNLGRKKTLDQVNADNTTTRLTAWTYDTLLKGLPTSATHTVNGKDYTNEIRTYNPLGKPTAVYVTIPSGASTVSYRFGTQYKPDGTSISRISIPATPGMSAEDLMYTYDNTLGLPTKLEDGQLAGIDPLLPTATYTELGKPARFTLNNNHSTAFLSWYYQDSTQRLATTRLERGDVAGYDADTHYTYDPAGNVKTISDTPTADSQCFTYDYLRRLTEAWTATDNCGGAPSTSVLGGPAPYWQSFTYDPTGNRTGKTDHNPTGGTDTTHTYHYSAAATARPHAVSSVDTAAPAGDHTETYGYNEVGDTATRGSQTLTYDAEDHPSTVTDGTNATSYVYDADGNQLLRTDPSGTTLFLPYGVEIHTNPDSTQTSTRHYTFGGQTIAVRTPAGLSFLAGDPHGTATHAIDSVTGTVTTRRLDPFGNPRTASTPLPGDHGFVGGVQDDNTGLTHLGARDYDPALGRFLTVDPIMDITDPQSMNNYAYADNNPVTRSDPTGLRVDDTIPGANACNQSGNKKACNTAANYPPGPGGSTSGGSSSAGGGSDTGVDIAFSDPTRQALYFIAVTRPNSCFVDDTCRPLFPRGCFQGNGAPGGYPSLWSDCVVTHLHNDELRDHLADSCRTDPESYPSCTNDNGGGGDLRAFVLVTGIAAGVGCLFPGVDVLACPLATGLTVANFVGDAGACALGHSKRGDCTSAAIDVVSLGAGKAIKTGHEAGLISKTTARGANAAATVATNSAGIFRDPILNVLSYQATPSGLEIPIYPAPSSSTGCGGFFLCQRSSGPMVSSF